MEPRPDIESLCCINPECKHFAHKGQQNLKVRKTYGKDSIRYLRCTSCGEEFSERKGTALFNSKIAESKAASIIEHLDSGCGVVATAHLLRVAKDTVSRLVRVAGRTSRGIHDCLVRNIKPKALQFDEKWSFAGKKQKNVSNEDDPDQVGDHWDVNCLDPRTKLLVTVVPGKRTAEAIHRAVTDAASRLAADAAQPAIFTDGEPAYTEAILSVFGHRYPAPRTTHRGRRPAPVLRVPQDLIYAQVIKHRRQGQVKSVEIRPIFGKGKLEGMVEELGWRKANTSAIERFNLTDRMRNGRKARKTLSFSRRTCFHDWMSFISAVRYNFHHPHRSLRQPGEGGGWRKRSPGMAATLVDHIYSSIELLRLCPVGLG
jgi:transposase-like protein